MKAKDPFEQYHVENRRTTVVVLVEVGAAAGLCLGMLWLLLAVLP